MLKLENNEREIQKGQKKGGKEKERNNERASTK